MKSYVKILSISLRALQCSIMGKTLILNDNNIYIYTHSLATYKSICCTTNLLIWSMSS